MNIQEVLGSNARLYSIDMSVLELEFEVSMLVDTKIMAFWFMTPYSFVDRIHSFCIPIFRVDRTTSNAIL
jgi:hypothetical protein